MEHIPLWLLYHQSPVKDELIYSDDSEISENNINVYITQLLKSYKVS